jgi:hypothetical protein
MRARTTYMKTPATSGTRSISSSSTAKAASRSGLRPPATAVTQSGAHTRLPSPGSLAETRSSRFSPTDQAASRIADLPDHVPGNGFIDLTPVGWSDNGRALLASGENGSSSVPVAVDPDTGETRKLAEVPVAVDPRKLGESETIHTAAISHDGRFALVYTEPFLGEKDEENATVLIVPYAGGKPTIDARGAGSPSWNR